ncbi:glutathione S-transferase-like isoform X11 [Ochotona curzoniae]|uniref:glutathione S-transferase-like isoform X11 n=1 Tax=Ochotona curzoniae TaxID=130825 RepID=UPI001B3470FB|nr:glutathione S-transferase-like isoform X11 [Ochotona curzoniae]
MPMTLGYWELRGLALPIRLLLEYTGTSYEEKHYRMGDAPDYDRSQWLNEKFKLGLDFPNEKLKPDYLKGLPDKLTLYSQFLGKQPWFAGDKITIADFLVYDVLDQNRIFAPGCLDVFPNLKDFMARFEGLPKIAAYLKSSRFIKVPLFLKSATWTGK